MPSDNTFSAPCYLARYPDLQTGWMYWSADNVWKYGKPTNRKLMNIAANPYWHFQNFGMKEGRVGGCDLPGTMYSNLFDSAAYTARYPDVKSGIDSSTGKPNGYANNPLGHYQFIGISQNRLPGYELINSQSPQGMTSPGTTQIIPDTATVTPDPGLQPGDNTQPVDLNANDQIAAATAAAAAADNAAIPPVATTAPADNTMYYIGGGLLLLLLLLRKHKRPK